ncbi:MAG: hypothetical protein ABI839_06040 [Verrucomicrobiota bacterium]
MEIHKGIPLPARRADKRTSVLLRMEAGDSIVVPDYDEMNRLSTTARYHGVPITRRRQPDGTYRVWRLEDSPRHSANTNHDGVSPERRKVGRVSSAKGKTARRR